MAWSLYLKRYEKGISERGLGFDAKVDTMIDLQLFLLVNSLLKQHMAHNI